MLEKVIEMLEETLTYKDNPEKFLEKQFFLEPMEQFVNAINQYPELARSILVCGFIKLVYKRKLDSFICQNMIHLYEENSYFPYLKGKVMPIKNRKVIFNESDLEYIYSFRSYEPSLLLPYQMHLRGCEKLLRLSKQGVDITSRDYMAWYTDFSFFLPSKQYHDVLFNLYIKWNRELEREYISKSKIISTQPQVGSLIPLPNVTSKKQYPSSNVKKFYSCEVDQSINFRELLAIDETSALLLMGDQALIILTRICYGIEEELSIIKQDKDLLVMEKELIDEKNHVLKCINQLKGDEHCADRQKRFN